MLPQIEVEYEKIRIKSRSVKYKLRHAQLPFGIIEVDEGCYKCILCGEHLATYEDAIAHFGKHLREAMNKEVT
ncbi:MAG: hypothetical protein DRJ03_16740 [Chloroflexi bacterium]|nr:MAG: hypothetical protein DRJ03_16740 [Chloroflexota bacterium]